MAALAPPKRQKLASVTVALTSWYVKEAAVGSKSPMPAAPNGANTTRPLPAAAAPLNLALTASGSDAAFRVALMSKNENVRSVECHMPTPAAAYGAKTTKSPAAAAPAYLLYCAVTVALTSTSLSVLAVATLPSLRRQSRSELS